MRIEVFCEDQLDITRKLLDLLVARNIDLRGIEVHIVGRIFLHFSELDFDVFRQLMIDIRRLHGVTDVGTVACMPSERQLGAFTTLLTSLPEPIFFIDLKGQIALANDAALTLFSTTIEQVHQQAITSLIDGSQVVRDIENGSDNVTISSSEITLHGQNYLLETTPIPLADKNEAINVIGTVIVLRNMATVNKQRKNDNDNDNAFDHIIAVNPNMRQVVEQARKWALLDAPLLITGETGTGKDILALACHGHSGRRDMPFLALNCAALPDEVVESELFGHAAGAYPNALEGKKGFFELASGGAVLLDEIGEMSPRMQTKLLRFLSDGTFRRVGEEQEVQVDIRVICATQRNLIELVNKGLFREDLYYRLNVLTLQIPPLRDRVQDIMPLAELFTRLFAHEQGIAQPKLAPELNSIFTQYGWPGNVRQLKNIIYRALTELSSDVLKPQDISLPEFGGALTLSHETMDGSLDDISKRFERSVLIQLYTSYPSTRKLAKRLGVSHTAIANKLREYGLGTKKEG